MVSNVFYTQMHILSVVREMCLLEAFQELYTIGKLNVKIGSCLSDFISLSLFLKSQLQLHERNGKHKDI